MGKGSAKRCWPVPRRRRSVPVLLATVESNAHPDYKRAILAAYAKDTALTICFQDGWPATHRALRNAPSSCGTPQDARPMEKGPARAMLSRRGLMEARFFATGLGTRRGR